MKVTNEEGIGSRGDVGWERERERGRERGRGRGREREWEREW